MTENGFSIELNERFEALLLTKDWRQRTIEQLFKDMHMAGVRLDEEPLAEIEEDPFGFIANVIQEVKGNKPVWDNLNYRIDLPSNVALEAMTNQELAHLYLLRSFQKVWLRHQFSDAAAKDGANSMQKHLKP